MKFWDILWPHLLPMLIISIICFILPLLFFVWIEMINQPKNKVFGWLYKQGDKIPPRWTRIIIFRNLLSFISCVSFIIILYIIYSFLSHFDAILETLTKTLLIQVVNGGFWSIFVINIIYWMWKYGIIFKSKNEI